MKRLSYLFLILFIIQSCQKESLLTDGKDIHIAQNRSSSIDSTSTYYEWFSYDNVQRTLKKNSRKGDSLSYQHIDYFIDDLSNRTGMQEFERLFNLGMHPAWSLGEPSFFQRDHINFYVPMYDLQSRSSVQGIFILRSYQDVQSYYYLSRTVLSDVVYQSPFTKYWNGIFDYFDGPLTKGRYDEKFSSVRFEPCRRSDATHACKCTATQADCGTWHEIGNGQYELECWDSCSDDGNTNPTGGTTGGGSSTEPLDFSNEDWGCCPIGCGDCDDGIPDDCHPLTLESYPPNSNSLYNGNSGICSTWDSYINNFNCEDEEWPDESGDTDNSGGTQSTGMGSLEIIMNSGDLHSLQLQIMIEKYNLPLTVDEIKNIAEGPCGTSTYQDVENVVKYALVDELGDEYELDDDDKWCIFENMGSYADINLALENSTYNTGHLPDCIACAVALNRFETEYGIDLTDEEKEAIKNGVSTCGGNEFEEEVTDIFMEECLGPFYQVFEQLENFSIEERLNYCNSELPEIKVDPPNCEGCSVGEAQTVWTDELKALDMLECTINKLNEFNGSEPQDVKAALEAHFGGTNSTLVSGYIKNLFRYIRSYPYDRGYQAQNEGEGLCGEFTFAWTFPAVQFANVRLCRPNYWSESDQIERAGTLIHEWMHLYYFAGDIAYDMEEEYNELNTLQQLFNADAFSELVKELCDD